MYIICMAKLLNVYIHDDNQEQLNNIDNKARLINDLLRDHFKKIDPNKMSIEELKQLYEKEKLKQEYENKLRLLENGFKTA